MSIVYVCGFVDVFNYPKQDRALYLNPDDVQAHLPLLEPIPLNVEHLVDAQVGWVLGLHVGKYGLFCVCVITSNEFLALVEKLCLGSNVAKTSPQTLPPEPILEMLHTWLPELSLSSIHPDSVSQKSTNLFQHVSLCAMGQRRGTVAVYGHSLEWTLSKFTSLTEADLKAIRLSHNSTDVTALPKPIFTCSNELLMAKAIDAGFIKNRLEILKSDKGVADVRAPTYLKACVQATPANLECKEATMNSQPFTGSVTTPQHEDFISVPRSTFMSMLQTNLDTIKQTPKPPNIDALTQAYAQHRPLPLSYPTTQTPPYYGAYGLMESPHGMYGPYMNIPQPYTWPQLLPGYGPMGGTYYPTEHPARPNKRKRDGFDDYETPLFPGEIQKDFQSLSKSITALQNELKDMKNTAPQAKVPSIGSNVSFPKSQCHYQPEYVEHVSPGYILKCVHPYSESPMVLAQQVAQETKGHVQESSTKQATEPVSEPKKQLKLPEAPTAASQPVFVEASSKPPQVNQLQKIFCDELLNKK
nr:capsid maturation protease [Macronycteris gammaherpesvirus 1]